MAITTLDGLIAATRQKLTLNKTTTRTTVANGWFSVFDVAAVAEGSAPVVGSLARTLDDVVIVSPAAQGAAHPHAQRPSVDAIVTVSLPAISIWPSRATASGTEHASLSTHLTWVARRDTSSVGARALTSLLRSSRGV